MIINIVFNVGNGKVKQKSHYWFLWHLLKFHSPELLHFFLRLVLLTLSQEFAQDRRNTM